MYGPPLSLHDALPSWQGRSLAELASVMTVFPQVLVNVKGVDRDRVSTDEVLQAEVAAVSAELGDTGRVLLRASGTEALVRVMVERSEEHTSELQSLMRISYSVFCLKKKT